MKRITLYPSKLATVFTALVLLLTLQASNADGKKDDRRDEQEGHSGPQGVVKSLNGLEGRVSLKAGSNITIVPIGNSLRISATPSGGGADSNAWHRGGDTAAPGNFLGTLNDQPLEFKVNGQRALRLEPNTNGAPNVIGGSSLNFVAPGLVGTVVGGGIGNIVQDSAYSGSTISGGQFNLIRNFGYLSTIGGGSSNRVDDAGSTISGGFGNAIKEEAGVNYGQSAYSVICGGAANTIVGQYGLSIGGGQGNTIGLSSSATIAGGLRNTINGACDGSVIAGGTENILETDAYSSNIDGGRRNTIQSHAGQSAIGGGYYNSIQTGSIGCTLAGGTVNTIQSNATSSAIGGGSYNTIQASAGVSVISGGSGNTVQTNADASVISGGVGNTAGVDAFWSTISGGAYNSVSGRFGTVAGGDQNEAGASGLAAGHRAKAISQGAFVWADSSDFDFVSSADNQFAVRCTGGAAFVTGIDGAGNATSGVLLPAGSGSWSSLSDRNAKENLSPVSGRAVLDKLCAMPLSSWNYKSQDKSIRHFGPMAQDFHAAFQIGEDDKHITTVDADGVALAAIQGLNELLQEKDSRILELEKRLTEIEKILTRSSHTGRDDSQNSER